MVVKRIRKGSTMNPFIDGINIPDELFCDRKEETREIIGLLKNGNKVVLKAPRRIGKSSLITHILHQKEISDKYNVLYLDILGTNNAGEFVRDFQRAFHQNKFTMLKRSLPGRLTIEAEYDGLTGRIKGGMGLGDFKEISLSLDEIFAHLENTRRPNIVVFDEFQQIKYYPEPMAAILRSHIQRLTNTGFIFSGSSRRMLSTMFDSYGEPFYHSAESVELQVISEPKYEEFCIKNFRDYGKDIEAAAVEFAYDLAAGNTYEIQRMMRSVFSFTGKGRTATVESVKEAVGRILEREDQNYREKLSLLNGTKERKVLLAIALEGVATEMLSQKMVKRYDLGSTSSLAQSLGFLCGEDRLNLVLRNGCSYKLQDKMFELWIAKQYDRLDEKFADAKAQFAREVEAGKELKLPKFKKSKALPPD